MEKEFGVKLQLNLEREKGNVPVREFLDRLGEQIDDLAIETINKYITKTPYHITEEWLKDNYIRESKVSGASYSYGNEGTSYYVITQYFYGVEVDTARTFSETLKLQEEIKDRTIGSVDLITPTGYLIPLDNQGQEIFELARKLEEISKVETKLDVLKNKMITLAENSLSLYDKQEDVKDLNVF